jgi:hypothetical protein
MANVARKLEKASMGKGRSSIWRLSALICNAEPTFCHWVPITQYEAAAYRERVPSVADANESKKKGRLPPHTYFPESELIGQVHVYKCSNDGSLCKENATDQTLKRYGRLNQPKFHQVAHS